MENEDHKLDYQAILPPGMHEQSLEQLRAITVDKFPRSKTRPRLFTGLVTVIARIQKLVPAFVLYVNGSFLTEKIDPEDIDCVVFFNSSFISTLPDRDVSALAFRNEIARWANGGWYASA